MEAPTTIRSASCSSAKSEDAARRPGRGGTSAVGLDAVLARAAAASRSAASCARLGELGARERGERLERRAPSSADDRDLGAGLLGELGGRVGEPRLIGRRLRRDDDALHAAGVSDRGARQTTARFRPSAFHTVGRPCRRSSSTPSTRPTADQPAAIDGIAEGVDAGDARRDAAGRHRHRQDDDDGGDDRAAAAARAVIAHNKTLAAQLCNEFRTYFPHNAVEYFVSYYDYYQPEAYVPSQGPLHREGLGDQPGDRPAAPRRDGGAVRAPRRDHRRLGVVHLRPRLAGDLQRQPAGAASRAATSTATSCCASSSRSSTTATTRRSGRGTFRVRGDTLEVFPAYAETAFRAMLFGDEVERLQHFDPLTGELIADDLEHVAIWPATHYNVKEGTIERAVAEIGRELNERCAELEAEGKLLEAHRLRQRTQYDMEMLREVGLLLRHRELLAHPRRPRARRAPVLPARLLPQRLRLLHRRVAPDRAADRRHVRGRPLAQADARRLRLPAAERARQPAADVRRVPVDHAADGVRVGDAGRTTSASTRRASSSRSSARPGSSTRRSRCARRATRSTT